MVAGWLTGDLRVYGSVHIGAYGPVFLVQFMMLMCPAALVHQPIMAASSAGVARRMSTCSTWRVSYTYVWVSTIETLVQAGLRWVPPRRRTLGRSLRALVSESHGRPGFVVAPWSCPVVEQPQGRFHAVGEELIGQVAVCQRPGELQGAEHQSKECERVGPSRLGVCRV